MRVGHVPRRDPVRVARPPHHRGCRRRLARLPRRARARDPTAGTCSPPSTRTSRRRREHDRGRARRAARAAVRPRVRRPDRGRQERRDRDRQPVPAHARLQDPARRAGRARGGRHDGRLRDLRERQGLPDVRLRHRAEGRPREPRAHGAHGDRVPPERPPQRRALLVRRRLVARHARLAAQRGRQARGQDHARPGAVQPLGRGRRRQADPARRGLGRDDRVEPLRVRALAADALRRRGRARCAPTSTRSRRCAA